MKSLTHSFLTPIILLALLIALTGCGVSTVAPDSDSGINFASGAGVPIDDQVHVVTGVVVGDVESLPRQSAPAVGYISGYNGMVSGSFYGPQFDGKGFIRLKVESSDTDLAPVGQIVLLKSTDTKGSALLPGDRITLKCRAQYENVTALRPNEPFDKEKYATWELDYCRMETPVIVVITPAP